MHVTLGKVSAPAHVLSENLQALLKALTGRVEKVNITATMSPSVRVVVE
jgi:ribosomal protein L1